MRKLLLLVLFWVVFSSSVYGMGTCFPAGTQVTMANGSKKAIENVQIGEKVVGRSGVNTVMEYERPIVGDRETYIINGEIESTGDHPFLTTDGWKVPNLSSYNAYPRQHNISPTQLREGDEILTKGGLVTVKNIVISHTRPYNEILYDFKLSGDNTYTANDYIVHNCGGGGGGSCFPANTQITMADGSKKPIEDVKIGDRVKSYNTKTNEYVNKKVTGLDFDYTVGSHAKACRSLGDAPSLYTINGLIEFTPEHPFRIKSGEWAALVPYKNQHPGRMQKLKEGQEIFVNNSWIEIKNISVSRSNVPDVAVYNFEVEDTNTYFANGILVHNKVTDDTESGPTFQECIDEDKECQQNFPSEQTFDIDGQQVTIEGDASTNSRGEISADKLKAEGIVHNNVKDFDVKNGKASYENAGKMQANVPGPEEHNSPEPEGYETLQNKDEQINAQGDVARVNQLIQQTNVGEQVLVSYLQDNYPDTLQHESVQDKLNVTASPSAPDEQISSPPETGTIEAEDISASDVEYEDGEIKDITFTSQKDDNNITFNGVRAVLDKDESISISKNNGKYEIETTDNATVEDGYLSTRYIEIAPGSRYNFVGWGSSKFAVYIPSDASAFKLYIRTLASEPETLSCSQCGLIDFVNNNATLKGNYEFEKPSSTLPVFTNIIEANGPFRFTMDNTATNLTRLFPSIQRAYSGAFEVVFNRQGYSFYDGQKPYVIEKINPTINITNKTLKRTRPRNSFMMYPESSGGFFSQWQEVIYE